MGQLHKYRSDTKAMREGVWVDFGDPNDPISFKLAFFSGGLAEAVQALPPKERQLARDNRLPAKELLELIYQATSEHVILDWRNMQDEEGEPIPYSIEKAEEIMRDERLGELHEFIFEVAKDRATFRETQLRESEGNS